MENINDMMDDFKRHLNHGRIQKAYRYIFEIFSDVVNQFKEGQDKTISTHSLYHGYLDMSYLPVTTEVLKVNGLKIAVVFNYSSFQFEIWLSAVNRQKRKEFIDIITRSSWKKYKPVENDENTDAIIDITIKGIDDFSNKNGVVTIIANQVRSFIDDTEAFIRDYGTSNRRS
ncbi:MAG: hypothetical protein KBA26_09900 [Candidatus Delongbacteria bacterium]|nr:hypothetical protein [Candidatus Delongbacteria bacterium]